MVSIHLEQLLSGHAFAFVIVFTRISSVMMLFPGISEHFVSARIRLMFGLMITLLVFMPLQPVLPSMPADMGKLLAILFHEVLVGVFFGSLLRLLMDIVETAGSIIAMQIGLSNAMILNPSMATQSALPSVFLTTAALVTLFGTGLDHVLLRGMVDTYNLFPPMGPMPTGDVMQTYAKLMTKAFAVGVELAAPFLIVGLLIYITLGFMQRLVAQVQLFMVMLPLQIWGGLFLFATTTGIMLSVWLSYFNDAFTDVLVR